MAEYIKRQDSLNTGREKINRALTDANTNANKAKQDAVRALANSLSAEQIAQLAKLASENTQQQLDDIILNDGTGNAEVIQARGGEPLLKDRLNKVDSRFTENKKSLDLKRANAEVPLNIITDSVDDNHVVHPYVLDFPDRKYGYLYVMAYTPYSESRDRFENPSIVVSYNRYSWIIPTGATNPVIPQPHSDYHYSDPMLLDNGKELEMWYRLTDKRSGGQGSKILMVKTTDLINWTEPKTIFDYGQFDTAYISPTGHKEIDVYKIWYRDVEGNYVLRTSRDLSSWSEAIKINFDFGEYSGLGYRSWHNEVKRIDGKYMMIVNTLPDPSPDLFLFESDDGVNFTVIKKIMEPSLNGFDSYRLYKASIIKYGLWYYVYYSAFARDNSNHIGLTKATSALEFTGMRSNERTSTELHTVYGANGLVPVVFPNGIHLGNGVSKAVNFGVGGYNTEITKQDTMTIKTDRNTRKGYYEMAGFYLDSENNDSIQGIHMDKGASYLDKKSKGLSIHPDGTYKQRYARYLSFIVNLVSGNLTIQEGSDSIGIVESVTHGFKINFKNMAGAHVPTPNIMHNSPEGILSNDVQLTHLYIREIGPNHLIVGVKDTPNGRHFTLDEITFGTLRVNVIF